MSMLKKIFKDFKLESNLKDRLINYLLIKYQKLINQRTVQKSNIKYGLKFFHIRYIINFYKICSRL